jgi:hypothetical protein
MGGAGRNPAHGSPRQRSLALGPAGRDAGGGARDKSLAVRAAQLNSQTHFFGKGMKLLRRQFLHLAAGAAGVPGRLPKALGASSVRGLRLHIEPIGLFCGAAEERGLLIGGIPGRDALESIPQDLIAASALINRKITFEHRTLRPEGRDAGLYIGTLASLLPDCGVVWNKSASERYASP